MRGQYADGGLGLCRCADQQFIGYSAYCYRWSGQVQIKRLRLVGRNIVRILSATQGYPPIDVPLEGIEIGGGALAVWTPMEF